MLYSFPNVQERRALGALRSLCLIFLLASVFPQAATSQPTRAEVDRHIRNAETALQQRRFADAEAEARSALTLDPSRPAAWKLHGLALQLLRRYAEAEEDFAAAATRFPENADLWFYLARVQYLQSSLRAGERSVRRSLELDPLSPDAHLQLGMILEARHDYQEALRSFERAVELSAKRGRGHSLTYLSLAQLLVKLERFDQALNALTAAKRLDPKALQVLLLRGRVFERLGRFKEAEAEYREATPLDTGVEATGHLERLKGRTVLKAKNGASDTSLDAPCAVSLQNVAGESGLQFVLANGATGNKYQVETMVGGVAVIDFDGDGNQDIYFTNGAELPLLEKTSDRYANRLFRNQGNATFVDVTEKAGLRGSGYSIGAAVADYDNDGDADLFVAGVHANALYRNRGDGTFEDVTRQAALASASRGERIWSVAAVWLDYDNDGDLDLFVSNYCHWTPESDPYCGARVPGYRTYCHPDKYPGLSNRLFRNNGDGSFADVSASSGVLRHVGKGMGVAIADYDGNGFVDVVVANDTMPNFLFRNTGRGTFEEVGLLAGVGLNDSRMPTSSMGTDFRDYDNDGREDIIVTALSGETFPVFRNAGNGYFADESVSTGLGLETAKRSGWGMGLVDLDNDGDKDLFTSNAHVVDNIELYNEQRYQETNALFVNQGNGRFKDFSALVGEDFQAVAAHRGCAFADFNNDGRIDIVATAIDQPAELWLNRSTVPNHWVLVRLVGTASNRDGIGAKIKVTTPDGRVQYNHVTTSVGYASSSDARVHFGLGAARSIKALEVRWPSGAVQVENDLAVDRVITLKEPTGTTR